MVRNTDFALSIEERDNPSFFKILQSSDLSSENMRAIPQDFARKIPEKELLSIKMVLRVQWGTSWEINLSRNTRFYFMEKRGWDKFVNDNALGQQEFLTFTYHGEMCFSVHIYQANGEEMLRPRKSKATPSSASGGFKTEQEKKKMKNDVKEEPVTSEMSYLGRRTPESMEATKQKHKNKMTSVPRDSPRDSVPQFVLTIQRSYLSFLAIPKKFVKYMPKDTTLFFIHHPDGSKSWEVTYLMRETRSTFSGGWGRVAKEYSLAVGDVCTFKLIKPTELLLIVS